MRMMTLFRAWLALAALLVVIQTNAVAHETEHGHHDHDHHGVECEIEVVAIEAIAILPVPPVLAHFRITPLGFLDSATASVSSRPSQRNYPPPRAPPPFNQ